ncbi:MAG: N-acetylmuramoyl-L-alanine amidase [Lachnospiraceae bacterium]|nr:N-acetylmuramoyl-L-alanine amidase [Lachnospiraceae bacterium]
MTIGINCGHTAYGAGYGSVGLIKESEHTRRVGYALMEKLRDSGVKAIDCTVNKADSQQQYLEKAVALANREELDWFVSIHFNASASHAGHGTEIYTYKGCQYPEVLDILSNMAKLGFDDRGVKDGSGFYVIRKTKARAILIEVCFCDNQEDMDIYSAIGAEAAVAHAIFNGIYKYTVKTEALLIEHYDFSFAEYVGKIAEKDWRERRIVLPSVVVAQAMKESAWGTSELAKEANALFGIKKNG